MRKKKKSKRVKSQHQDLARCSLCCQGCLFDDEEVRRRHVEGD